MLEELTGVEFPLAESGRTDKAAWSEWWSAERAGCSRRPLD